MHEGRARWEPSGKIRSLKEALDYVMLPITCKLEPAKPPLLTTLSLLVYTRQSALARANTVVLYLKRSRMTIGVAVPAVGRYRQKSHRLLVSRAALLSNTASMGSLF